MNKVGIFSKPAKLDQGLNNMDRIEIYRKLIADPKEVRKQRAAEGKKMKKGGDKSKNNSGKNNNGKDNQKKQTVKESKAI